MNCKKCSSENVIIIQYGYPHPEMYDGWSEISCQDCKSRHGRWTGQELKDDECESRWGERGVIKNKS